MIRAAFLGSGICMVLFGGALMFVDEVALSPRFSSQAAPVLSYMGTSDPRGRCHLQPPEWAPYTLAGVGFVTVLYAFALPRPV